MARESNPTLPAAPGQALRPHLVGSNHPIRNANRFPPQTRALIAEDCRRRGSAETAKVWGITVHAAWDCRVEALERTIRRVEAAIAAKQDKRAA